MRTRTLVTLLATAAILCFMTPITQAQTATTGQIVGVVTDPSGAVVAGAGVVLTSDAGVRRQIVTGNSGRYTFPLLDPGAYRLEVTQTGFASAKVEGIVVQITESSVVDVALRVAGAPATVSVTGESALVQTESSAKGTVIGETQVRDLPLPTRNFQQLLALTTGTSGPIQNSSELGRGDVPLYVNGQRSVSNSVVINGVDANSIGTGSTPNLAGPSIDSLQEFKVQTSMYDAVQGRNAGGVVAVVTKSGTNNLHGDLFEFFRNTALDANNFFLNEIGTARPTYDRNQFGGVLGGPIVKDRAWFFASYQGSRETNGTSLTNSLSTLFLPAYLGSQRDPASLAAFSVCYGLGGYVDPVAQAALTAKLPNGQYMIPSVPGVTTGAGCTLTNPNPGEPVLETIPSNSTYKEDQFNINLDFKLNDKTRIFGKFFYAKNRENQALYDTFGDGNALQAPGWPTEEDVTQRLLSVGALSLLSSHLLNEVRFGWSEIYGPGKPAQPISAADLGIYSTLGGLFPGMPTLSFTNMFTLGPSPLAINYAKTDTKSISGMMTWTKMEASSGIKTRWHAPESWATSDVALPAAKLALERAGKKPEDVDLIILGTDSPDYITPATSVVLQYKLGAKNAGTFDVGCACASFPTGLSAAAGIIAANPGIKTVLVIGVYLMHKLTSPADPMIFFYGDGAGAAVLEAAASPGFITSNFRADGSYHDYWGIYSGGTFEPASADSVMAGRTGCTIKNRYPPELNEETWPLIVQRLAKDGGFALRDVDCFIFTQVRKPTIERVMERLGVPSERAHTIMDKYGYTGSACVGMALDHAIEQGKVKSGNLVVLVGSGVGYNQAGCAFRMP